MSDKLPDRIAIDARGCGWRVWDDSDMWSMVPTNLDNNPVPEPVTWYVPVTVLEEINAMALVDAALPPAKRDPGLSRTVRDITEAALARLETT